MVKLIHEAFTNKPNVLCVGDGVNDTWMMEVADVSIELKAFDPSEGQSSNTSINIPSYNKNDNIDTSSRSIFYNTGDVCMRSLKCLKSLMLYDMMAFQDQIK